MAEALPIPPGEPTYSDRLPAGHVRGRAATLNPGNRFDGLRLHVLGDHLDQLAAEQPNGRQVPTTVLADHTHSIINEVNSPDISFRWTVNPYRGCEHGCVYCYARPTHETLGMSCGLDFETKIVAKHDAPELLRKEISRPKWQGEPIVLSGVTDPYQPIEAELNITRRCLEVLADAGNPVSVITKNRLILRDADLLARLAQHGAARAAVSITTLDNKLARTMEPRASAPRERLLAVEGLAKAGIPVSVMVAPIIFGLNDHELPQILHAASQAGATSAGYVLLRLPHQLKGLFLDWAQTHFAQKAARIESLLRQSHGGDLYNSDWRTRQTGSGQFAEQLNQTFRLFARRYGLDKPQPALSGALFVRPPADVQQGVLF